ncbi:MAG: hypothetical protein J7K73_02075 [Nanoarchaeota archaeon]|nr:hypothetical protein [Nanoarchaeota archaeon]
MKHSTAIIIFMAVLILSSIALYQVFHTLKVERRTEQFNRVCQMLTDELNRQVNETSKCRSYYCYYAPYAAPDSLQGKATTLCVCDCKLENDTVITVQVLTPT